MKATIITGMCEGLNFLHLKDIVHQDLKPDNIMVSADREFKQFTDLPSVHSVSIRKCKNWNKPVYVVHLQEKNQKQGGSIKHQ